MSVPSSNLLAQALGVIQPVPFVLVKDTGRTLNSVGIWVTEYDTDPVEIYGSIQAVQRSLYNQLGLDMQKNYITIYASADLMDVSRDRAGDRVHWDGKQWQVLSQMPWKAIDGWVSVLAVDIGWIPV